jgi:hypothetical protein
VALLLINNSRTTPSSVELPTPSERFTLSAHGLEDTEILLNGTALRLGAGDELPALNGKPTSAGRVVLPAATITFLVLSNAGNLVCQ